MAIDFVAWIVGNYDFRYDLVVGKDISSGHIDVWQKAYVERDSEMDKI